MVLLLTVVLAASCTKPVEDVPAVDQRTDLDENLPIIYLSLIHI